MASAVQAFRDKDLVVLRIWHGKGWEQRWLHVKDAQVLIGELQAAIEGAAHGRT